MARIVLDCRPLYNGHSLRGIGYMVRHLVPEILKIEDHEFVLLTYSSTDPIKDLNIETILEIWTVNRPLIRERLEWLWDFIGLWRVYRRHKRVDLTHFFSLNWAFGIGRIFLTVNDIFPLTDKRYQKPFDQWLRWKIMRRFIPQVSGMVAISQSTASSIKKLYLRLDQEISVGYLAPDESFQPISVGEENQIRSRLNLPDKYILSVGGVDNAEPRKNLDLLLSTFEKAAALTPDLHLIIVGRAAGKAKENIINFGRQFGLSDKIHLAGFVPEKDYASYFQAASLYLHVSAAEGFGLPLAQALACGLPIVALDNTSVKEVVGEAGILIKEQSPELLADAIKDILKVGSYFSKKALQESEKFNWSDNQAVYRETYHKALKIM